MSCGARIIDYLDTRIGLRTMVRENLTGYLLPRRINGWYALGSVLLVLFAIQAITGALLLVHYIPFTEQAFDSVQRIMNQVPFGWLVRDLHAVGANIIIVFLLLHLLSVLFMAAYKRPREMTWMAGFLLFLLAQGMCLTGYLLPWSQLSYWATTVATQSAGAMPLIGEPLIRLLGGEAGVGQHTLGLFFALHVMGLPLALAALLLLHLFLVRRIGVSEPPFGPDFQPRPPADSFRHASYPDGIPFFPDYFTKDLAVVCLALTLLMGCVFFIPWIFLPATAFIPADPFSTPVGIKPEWYFLASYQLLKLLPSEMAGLLTQVLAVLFLLLLPCIDRGLERRPARRPVFLAMFVLGILAVIGLTIWGHFS